jgi:sarcosine oxidase subunit gamma
MIQKENVSMPDVVFESPLVGISRLGKRVLVVDGQTCTLSELPFIDMLNLRGKPDQGTLVASVSAITGLALPLQANTCSDNDQRQCLWLGPDEWLLKLRDGQGADIAGALRHALAGQHASVVEVGDGNTTLILQGPAAAALLSRGCPIDLHARNFPAQALAQTHIAKSGAVLLCISPGTHYEITVRRSFADYLFSWLCEAGTE